MRKKPYVDLIILGVFVSWALLLVIAKQLLTELNPAAFVLLRMVLSAVVMFAILLAMRKRLSLPRRYWKQMALVGLLGYGGYHLFFTIGLHLGTSLDAALILATAPVMTALLAHIFKVEHINRREWTGIIICFVTAAAVILTGAKGGIGLDGEWDLRRLAGSLILVLAAVCWAMNGIMSKKLLTRVDPAKITAYSCALASALVLIPFMPFLLKQDWSGISSTNWLRFAYTVIPCSTLSVLFFYYGVKHVGPTRTMIYQNTMPIITALFVLLLRRREESINIVQVIGMVTVFIGVYLTRTGQVERNKQ